MGVTRILERVVRAMSRDEGDVTKVMHGFFVTTLGRYIIFVKYTVRNIYSGERCHNLRAREVRHAV